MPRPRRIEAAASKAARAAQRHQVGRLRDLRVSRKTSRRYLDATLRFASWLFAWNQLLSHDLSTLDGQLCGFIEA
eukprot:6512434-Lingulodinium_polyedra.AAC.1